MSGELKFSIGNCDCTALFTFAKGWVQSFHYHASNEIIYIGDKDIKCFTRNESKTINTSTVCIVPPKVEHYFSPCEQGEAEKVSFRFFFELNRTTRDKNNMYYQFNTLFSAITDVMLLENTSAITLFRSLLEAVSGDYTDEYLLKNYASLILITLLKELKSQNNSDLFARRGGDEIKAKDFTLFAQIESYIAQNYMDKLTLERVASQFFVSPRQLSRLCLRVCQMSFKEILQNQRMMVSKQLLEQTELPLAEIAVKVGFDSYTGFYKSFVSYYEQNPQKMREDKQLNRKIEIK